MVEKVEVVEGGEMVLAVASPERVEQVFVAEAAEVVWVAVEVVGFPLLAVARDLKAHDQTRWT